MPVWALAKRNAGKPPPTMPTITRYFQSLALSKTKRPIVNGNRARKVREILIAPS